MRSRQPLQERTCSGPAARSNCTRTKFRQQALLIGFKAFEVAKMGHRVPFGEQRHALGAVVNTLHS
jgi:hypothetical protein